MQVVRDENETAPLEGIDTTTALKQRLMVVAKEKAKLEHELEVVREIEEEILYVQDKVSHIVCDMNVRVEFLENFWAAIGQLVPAGVNCAKGGFSKQGQGSLSPNVLEFTPDRSTASALLESPVRKKPQEFNDKVSLQAYRSQYELLAARNGWDHQECAFLLATGLKGAALEVLAQLDSAHGVAAAG